MGPSALPAFEPAGHTPQPGCSGRSYKRLEYFRLFFIMWPAVVGGTVMLIKSDQAILSIGMMSLAVSILLRRFVEPLLGEPLWLVFVEGVLVGASIVLNTIYLIRMRRKKQGG